MELFGFPDPGIDTRHHTSKVPFDINIEKSQHGNPQPFKAALSDRVFRYLVVVRLTINFDRQHQFMAEEIHDKVINGSLAQKPIVMNLPVLQLIP